MLLATRQSNCGAGSGVGRAWRGGERHAMRREGSKAKLWFTPWQIQACSSPSIETRVCSSAEAESLAVERCSLWLRSVLETVWHIQRKSNNRTLFRTQQYDFDDDNLMATERYFGLEWHCSISLVDLQHQQCRLHTASYSELEDTGARLPSAAMPSFIG